MGRFEGKKAVVLGLARSGIASARLLSREGARVTAVDKRDESQLGSVLAGLKEAGVRLITGSQDPAHFRDADLIVISPGVRSGLPILEDARQRGTKVIGELELASTFINGTMVAITGTNGKSTTTAFTGHIASSSCAAVFTGGNLGTPLCEAVLSGKSFDIHVVEVSSFQLETIETFRPDVALLLNLKPDHLDRHASFNDYAEAKRRIFMNQGPSDKAVVNSGDPGAVKLVSSARSRIYSFSNEKFSGDGAFISESEFGGYMIDWRDSGVVERYTFNNRHLPGLHNAENAAAAIAASRLAGVTRDAVESALGSFKGLEHRIEFVAVRNGAAWYNDSKATNVDSVEVSLKSFPGGIIWIAGGRHKGSPYSPLRSLVEGRVRSALLIGEAAPLIAGDLKGSTEFKMCGTLGVAIRTAAAIAKPGDTVLLSPACSSFDQFSNYEERGAMFKSLVLSLPGGPDAET